MHVSIGVYGVTSTFHETFQHRFNWICTQKHNCCLQVFEERASTHRSIHLDEDDIRVAKWITTTLRLKFLMLSSAENSLWVFFRNVARKTRYIWTLSARTRWHYPRGCCVYVFICISLWKYMLTPVLLQAKLTHKHALGHATRWSACCSNPKLKKPIKFF